MSGKYSPHFTATHYRRQAFPSQRVLLYLLFFRERQFVGPSVFVKLFYLFVIYLATLSLGTGCVASNGRMISE
jgi:hypothetical protein